MKLKYNNFLIINDEKTHFRYFNYLRFVCFRTHTHTLAHTHELTH